MADTRYEIRRALKGSALTNAAVDKAVEDVAGAEAPSLIDINPCGGTAISQVNWNDVVIGTYVAGNAHLRSSGPDAETNWDVVLAAGTWTVEASVIVGAGRGIITFALDGTDIGTYDTYGAVTDFKARGGVAGVVVPTSAKRRLRLKAATKNAASAAYMIDLVWLQLRRTA